jgi:adenine-specific DNA methylase
VIPASHGPEQYYNHGDMNKMTIKTSCDEHSEDVAFVDIFSGGIIGSLLADKMVE